MPRVLVTGSAGFIGFHLCKLLLDEGFEVHGYDGLTPYYDVSLKRRRQGILLQHANFTTTEAMLEDRETFARTADQVRPDMIVHLAAQAGVRHSLEAPLSYLEANVIGTLSVLEAARVHGVRHLLMASTSSVYGANTDMPFTEIQKADTQLTIYAASKKANESMAHAWAHLYDVPTTMFRFFTVYGPWGRPDLALYRFVDAILNSEPINIYNHGEMYRDFTYVDDLVRSIRLLMDVAPERPKDGMIPEGDSLSPVAPWRIVNIGNGREVKLLDFVEAIEEATGRKARRNYIDMQPGDMPATWADTSLLQRLTGYAPRTDMRDGIHQFVAWYRAYRGE